MAQELSRWVRHASEPFWRMASDATKVVDVDVVDLPGESADHLLDRILKNALGSAPVEPGVKKEELIDAPVKLEIKEIKAEPGDGSSLHVVKDELRNRSRSRRRRSRSRRRKRSRSRGKKKRSRSRGRRRRRKRSTSSSSSASSKSPVAAAMQGLPQARVVAVRGHWAQYLSPAGETFYKNVLTGEVQWQKPGNFDCNPSRRAGEMTPGPGEAACYIFQMPPEWSETDLMQLFSPFGQVTSAHVQRDANGFSRSCGFVTYALGEAANQACNMMNGFGVDGKFLKVSLTQFSMGTIRPSP
uniref:Uncharacterized protein n=1 Tax=Noctiluca scintillans TaxID=2966 RepID=A0A7S1B1Q8_NOCSC